MVMYLTGADIAAIRKALGLTLTAFGALVGDKAPATIYRWEHEHRRPGYDDMMKLNAIREKHRIRVPSQRREPQPA